MNDLTWVIFKKEWRDALRDRRTLMTMAMLVFMMPLIMSTSLQTAIKKATREDNDVITVLVANGEQAPTLMSQLKQGGITLEPTKLQTDAEISAKLENRDITAVLVIDPEYADDYQALRSAKMNLWSNSSTEQGGKLHKLKGLLNRYQQSIANWRLIARGVSPSLVQPVTLNEYDVADRGARASMLSIMFGMVFWMVFAVSQAMAIDITAGERERRTLELLMAQPASEWNVVIGKWLSASLLALVALILQLTFMHFCLLKLPLEEIGLSWSMGVPGLLKIALSGLPLCLFASSFIMALAMNTKSFKEAQATVGIAMFIPMIPVVVIPMLDIGTKSWMFAIPAVGNGELVRALAKGREILPVEWLMLLGVPSGIGLLLMLFCAMRLRSERFVVGV